MWQGKSGNSWKPDRNGSRVAAHLLPSPSAAELPPAGPEGDGLVDHYVSFICGRRAPLDQLFTPSQRREISRALSRHPELHVRRAPGERLALRKQDLSPEELERVRSPWLDRQILAWLGRHQAPAAPSPWPDNKPFALCITHDMDHVSSYDVRSAWRRLGRCWTHGERNLRALGKAAFRALKTAVRSLRPDHLVRGEDRLSDVWKWLQIERSFGFKSTLFYLPTTVTPWHPYDADYAFGDSVRYKRHRATLAHAIREIDRAGWEIGLHGTYYSATEPGVLKAQKAELEQCLGHKVQTTRQHYLQYDPRLSPALQAQAGFLADSTQGFNDLVGFRAGASFPYPCWDWQALQPLPLLEIPLHVQDGALFRQNPSADDAIKAALAAMESVQQVGGCLTILWHPIWLAREPGLWVFRTLLAEAKARNAWGCTAAELAAWWRRRVERASLPPAPVACDHVNAASSAE